MTLDEIKKDDPIYGSEIAWIEERLKELREQMKAKEEEE